MDVFQLRDCVTREYSDYITSFFKLRDARIDALVKHEFSVGRLWPAPLVQLNPSFEPGQAMDQLIAADFLHPRCAEVFRAKEPNQPPGPVYQFHKHQDQAIRYARDGHNYVLTTGTGSGKSLSYIVPIVDQVLRQGSGKGIMAIIVYPMNALANSQMGELSKFLDGFGERPVSFACYTGQESEAEKQRIISQPPDILLTNFVMLEYILVRPKERPLVRTMGKLKFLVLDELHTYRGRQGADVALLVRRLRQACGVPALQMVGTSATMSGQGSWLEQQREVARIASLLFGAEVRAEHVIGESLRRRTELGDVDSASFTATLQAVLDKPLPPLRADYASHPLARWLESRLGVTHDRQTLRLKRCNPRPIDGKGGVAEELAQLLGIAPEHAVKRVNAALLHRVEDGPFFAYRLHQFLAKGETVYASPEPPDRRHLTLTAQKYAPDSQRSRELFPLAFCRECGQDYYTVFRLERQGVLQGFEPRALGDTSKEDETFEKRRLPGFLLIDLERKIWPQDEAEQLELLPEIWLEEKRNGQVVRASHRASLPVTETIDARGRADGAGTPVLFFSRPFRFCPCCRVAFASRGSDFARLATLGSEGRSTATTITTKAVLTFLKGEKGAALPAEARKLLSFTDNRQDASLQAGHFNDFLQVLQIRRGLYRALTLAPQGLDYAGLNLAVFEAMALPYDAYASDPGAKFGRDDVDARFRAVLGYLLFRDLERGWRINSPNLEQCGLLRFHFKELDLLCADQEEWEACHPLLANASPAQRAAICRVLLDYLRKELAINAQSLNPIFQESIPRDSQDLTVEWSIAQMETMVAAKWAYAGPEGRDQGQRRGARADNRLFVTERGGFGRFLRRSSTFGAAAGKMTLLETRQLIVELFQRLARAGILERRDGRTPAYQIKATRMLWLPGEGSSRGEDPLRMPTTGLDLKPNPYFVKLYREHDQELRGFRAAEHTAQVQPETRKAREEAFRAAVLPLLFCSPTMELGVDIKDLNVVNMRNVPPTPANYAQRSGRAGRSGQPAFVFTYCTSGSPHDSYFFRRPQMMVSGVVKPPRLDLVNEDLVRAHVHAIWLHAANLELHASLADLLELSGKPPNPTLLPAVAEALAHGGTRRRAHEAAMAALGREIEALAEQQERSASAWLEEVLARVPAAFEAACSRWRELYVAAWLQSERQGRIVRDASRSAEDHKRARNLRDDAELRLRLLAETNERVNSDFYSYRYFASEGFLPGYNFPRLPITAFLRGRGNQSAEDGDALSRPRFLAISEFGPRALIYHEGSRYMINRVDIPVGHEGADPTTSAWQCRDCGYMHPPLDAKGVDICDQCGSANLFHYLNLFRMSNVGTRRRDRINSDEEERVRLGYRLQVGVRFPSREGRRSSRKGQLLGAAGQRLATLEYGSAATIWRLSLGWRHSKQDHLGFLLDLERGYWAKDRNSEDAEPEDGLSSAVKRVIPYVEDTRNSLLLELADPPGPEQMASLQAALKHAMQVYYQVEDRELEVEPLPSFEDRRVLLFYESAEGGAGVLRRFLDEKGDLAAIAALALELAHFAIAGDEIRDAAQDLPGEHCVAACYDCLLSYTNQPDHQRIDRMFLPDLLRPWLRARVETSPAHQPREQVFGQLLRLCTSELERQWLTKLYEEGYHLPDQAQTTLAAAGCRPDFLYSNPNQRVAIFVDAPHHRQAQQRARDEAADEALLDLGWSPLRFPYDGDWEAQLARYPSCFGRPKQRPQAAPLPTEATAAAPFDLDDFEPRWQPLLVRLKRLPGLVIESGEEYLAAGRTIGLSAAELSYGSARLVLLDGEDPDQSALSAHLQAKGRAWLILGEERDPYAEILAALGVQAP